MPVTVYGPANERTREVLREMLKENTGRHMLDSGGAYGRHWEKNEAEDFENHPDAWPEWRVATWRKDKPASLEANVTLDLYHFLAERLEFLPERQSELDAIAEANPDENWFEVAAHYAEVLGELGAQGPLGEGEPMTVNTYNHESLLSQTIQFILLEDPDGDSEQHICILQIHGGCDVRGGYTAPKVFRTWSYDILDDQKCEIACSNCHDKWGQRTMWSYEGYGSAYTEGDIPDLFDFPVQAYQPDEGFRRFLRRWLGDDFGIPGIVIVDEDANRASCPVCGDGELEIWAPVAS
jgi:hypothetical protein